MYRWRLSADSPWRLTDWEGVPQPIELTSDLRRVDHVPATQLERAEAVLREIAEGWPADKDQLTLRLSDVREFARAYFQGDNS